MNLLLKSLLGFVAAVAVSYFLFWGYFMPELQQYCVHGQLALCDILMTPGPLGSTKTHTELPESVQLPEIIYQDYNSKVFVVPLDKKKPDPCEHFNEDGFYPCHTRSATTSRTHVAPSGNYEFFRTPENPSLRPETLSLRDVHNGQVIVARNIPDNADYRDFVWSPNSQYISWRDVGFGRVRIIDVTNLEKPDTLILEPCWRYQWLLNSKSIVCYEGVPGKYYVYDISMGTEYARHGAGIDFGDFSPPHCYALAMAPDQSAFLCGGAGNADWAQKITLYSLDADLHVTKAEDLFNGDMVSPDRTVLVPMRSIINTIQYSPDGKYAMYFSAAPGVIDLTTHEIYSRGPHMFETQSLSPDISNAPQWWAPNDLELQ